MFATPVVWFQMGRSNATLQIGYKKKVVFHTVPQRKLVTHDPARHPTSSFAWSTYSSQGKQKATSEQNNNCLDDMNTTIRNDINKKHWQPDHLLSDIASNRS